MFFYAVVTLAVPLCPHGPFYPYSRALFYWHKGKHVIALHHNSWNVLVTVKHIEVVERQNVITPSHFDYKYDKLESKYIMELLTFRHNCTHVHTLMLTLHFILSFFSNRSVPGTATDSSCSVWAVDEPFAPCMRDYFWIHVLNWLLVCKFGTVERNFQFVTCFYACFIHYQLHLPISFLSNFITLK